jgi:nucleotide-binding universal stress UspA family protein
MSAMRAGRVIVGVDGSEASKRALRWAATYAAATGAPLEAVSSWEMPATYGWAATLEEPDPAKATLEKLESIVAEVVGDSPPVTSTVESGHAAFVLVNASKRADLLVVGSRGRGGFTGMLLGSVSQHCVQHAQCPVVVVRDQQG